MFGFLKKKIKEGISKLTGKIEDVSTEGVAAEQHDFNDETVAESEQQEVETPVVEKVVVEEKEDEVSRPAVAENAEPGQEEASALQPVVEKVVSRPVGESITDADADALLAGPQFRKRGELKVEEKTPEPFTEDQEMVAGSVVEIAEPEEGAIAEPEVAEGKEQAAEPVGEHDKEGGEEGPAEKKKGFFKKITSGLVKKVTTTTISREKFDELFQDMEMSMLENNVAVEVIDKLKEDLSVVLVDQPLKRTKIEETIRSTLRTSLLDVLSVEGIDLLVKTSEKKPFVICFVGINGSGKTTSIAKVAHMLKDNGKRVVLAAGDTFRAASIHQLQEHADKLDVRLIKHDYGSDPAAVAFDAVKHAKAKNADVVLIDTAGRMQNNENLMAELEKIIRIATPDLKIYVGEALAGNDCVEQVQQFNAAVGIDGIILTKADVDEKGGAMISASYVSGKPILYLGVGQEYTQLEVFDSEQVLARLEL